MADDEHGVRISGEITLEPQRAFEVEIVRRLVKEQQLRLEEEYGGKRNAHAPAARILPAGPALGRFVEAQTGENLCSTGRCRMGIDIRQSLMNVSNAVRIGGRFGFL